MTNECATALKRAFGYVPDEDHGEKWVVYRDRTLIVIHPDDRPKLFKYGCGGSFYEMEPLPA